MAVTYKDINLLTQKSSVAGTEKLPVSDTEYITPSQIAASVPVDSTLSSSSSNAIQNQVVATEFGKVVYLGDETTPASMDVPDAIEGITMNGSAVSVVGGVANLGTVITDISGKQDTLVSGTNIKTINNQSLLGSGNITISGGGGGGDTSDCVHKTGDESVGGDKTFTDNIAVVDASHILYSGASPSQGFTRGYALQYISGAAQNSITFTGLSGEPKAFVLSDSPLAGATSGVQSIVGDSTGMHGVYNTGSQHNYSAGFTKSYSNGSLTITAPSGVSFASGASYSLVYYYGDGSLTFKTSTIQPGSGVTAVTFTGTDLTEIPAMYATFLETAVNNESYRRVSFYTNSVYDEDLEDVVSRGKTFLTGGPVVTTSSFSVSYNNGLYINSGGTNAGGYFHNPGTYTLYYLMASDIGGGGSGSYSSLADELAAINTTIGDIATILASI